MIAVLRTLAALLCLSVLVSAQAGGRADVGGPEDLPLVPVRITNDTDTMLSVTILPAPCAPRVLLRAGESVVVDGCLRWGLIYQVVAVAYTDAEVLGRRHVLLVARPGAEWVLTRAGGA